MDKAKIRLTGTSITKSYVDAGVEFRSFIKDVKGIDTALMEIPSSKRFEVKVAGTTVSLEIYRPRAKGGAFRRISIKKDFVTKFSLVPGTELLFIDVDGEIHMDIICPEQRSPLLGAVKTGYPDAFSDWFSSNKGGVRFIFDQSSGKPLLDLSTPLTTRLAGLAKGMAEGSTRPKVVMLAGGAGNGKTHAIEKFMLSLVQGEGTFFQDEFRKRSKVDHTVVFNPATSDFDFFLPAIRKYDQLVVIQDASEASEGALQPSEYLAKQLEDIIKKEASNKLLLVCVNRGVLFSAASKLRAKGEIEPQIRAVTSALDPLNVDMACWPLQEYPDFFIWPLDLDSLTAQSNGQSILEQLLEGLQQQDWGALDQLAPDHPAKFSLQCLRTQAFRLSLAKAFREYEVASSKNLSFRRLNSVIGYLFTGGWTPQEGKREPMRRFADLKVETGTVNADSWRARLEVYSFSLPHLLFPSLPEVQAIRRFLSDGKRHDPEVENLLKALCDGIDGLKTIQSRRSAAPGAELFLKPENEWCLFMDPARSSLAGTGLEDLDIKLALDLSPTIAGLRGQIDPSSWVVLEWLVYCSDKLGRSLESEQHMLNDLHRILRWIARFAAVVVKRALAVHLMANGSAKLHSTERIERYIAIQGMTGVQREQFQDHVCEFMLGDPSTGEVTVDHIIELAKGLCQPFSRKSTAVRLLFNQKPEAKLLSTSALRPHTNLHVFEFQGAGGELVRAPITLAMHDFMHDVKHRHQLTGSMPAAIRGAIDSLRLQLDGKAMRGGYRARFVFDSKTAVSNVSTSNLPSKVGYKQQ
jgi:hypothetical protein